MSIRASTLFLGVTEALLCDDCRVRFRAEGTSMHPTIRDGDTLWVAPVEPSDVHRLDVLFYRGAHAPIAHRVRSLVRDGERTVALVLQGDAVGTGPERIDPSQILGRVVAVEREGRKRALVGCEALARQILHLALHRAKRGCRRNASGRFGRRR